MKRFVLAIATASAAMTGCQTPSPQDTACTVTAPENVAGDNAAAQQVAVDLTAFAKLPVKVDFKNELKGKFDFAFQKVSDSNARCQMLTQLAACYKDQPGARSEVLGLIMTTKACGG